jgi:hypothetical protein
MEWNLNKKSQRKQQKKREDNRLLYNKEAPRSKKQECGKRIEKQPGVWVGNGE